MVLEESCINTIRDSWSLVLVLNPRDLSSDPNHMPMTIFLNGTRMIDPHENMPTDRVLTEMSFECFTKNKKRNYLDMREYDTIPDMQRDLMDRILSEISYGFDTSDVKDF